MAGKKGREVWLKSRRGGRERERKAEEGKEKIKREKIGTVGERWGEGVK